MTTVPRHEVLDLIEALRINLEGSLPDAPGLARTLGVLDAVADGGVSLTFATAALARLEVSGE